MRLARRLDKVTIRKKPLHWYNVLAIHPSDQIAFSLQWLMLKKTGLLLIVKQRENSVLGW